MRLLDKIMGKTKQRTEETVSKTPVKDPAGDKKAGPEHGFLDAVREEIETAKDGAASSREAAVEEIYQDLIQRKQKGKMPRNPSEALMDVLGKPPASEVYATGAAFELSRQHRDLFIKALQASDTQKLFDLFRATFALFIDQPETVGLTETMFNKKSEDTDPLKWEVRCASAPDGSSIALCCMPVQHKTLSARLVGIVFSDSGDRYYSCMLNKDETRPSEILRSMGNLPPVQAGTVSGTCSAALDGFLDCIRTDAP